MVTISKPRVTCRPVDSGFVECSEPLHRSLLGPYQLQEPRCPQHNAMYTILKVP